MDMKKTLYLMRHGQTLFNLRRKMQGHCDSPLTPLGKKQAEIAGEYLKNIHIDHAYSSSLERCCDTLEIATNGRIPYVRLKGLKEMNFGLFEGESVDLKPTDKKDYESFFLQYGGESLSQVKERMLKTCTEIMEKEYHNTVLAVSHGLASLCFLSNFEDTSELMKTGIPNCTIFKYEYENEKFKLIEIIRHDFSQIEEALAY